MASGQAVRTGGRFGSLASRKGGSDFIVGWRTIEPVFQGLAVWPALIGGLVAGIVVEVVTRFSTGGHYTRPMAT